MSKISSLRQVQKEVAAAHWTEKDIQRFHDLVVKSAICKITYEEKAELDRLTVIRRLVLSSREDLLFFGYNLNQYISLTK